MATVKEICQSFRILPQQIHGMEAGGVIRDLPHTDPRFIIELAKWHRRVRGSLPREAEALLQQAEAELAAGDGGGRP